MALQRKCSCCRRPGHTKKACPRLVGKIRKDTKSKMVLVSVGKTHQKSPHLVDLRDKTEKSTWQGVNIFQETPHLKESRVMVDWAEMVRTANESQKSVKSVKSIKLEKNRTPFIFHLSSLSSYIIHHTSYVIKLVQDSFLALHKSILNTSNTVFHSFNARKFAYGMIALVILASLPLPAFAYYQKLKRDGIQVVTESTNAFLALQSSTVAGLQGNFTQAQTDLNLALNSFGQAQTILEKEHQALVYLMSVLPVVGHQVESRQQLLLAGHHLALGNTYLIKGIKETSEDSDLLMTDKLVILANHLRSAIPQYEEALTDMSQVDESVVPEEFQQSFYDFKTLFAAFVNDMKDAYDLSGVLISFLGSDQPRRYLVVFQNQHELRPTGGFMGSYGILDVQKGKIMGFDIPGRGTYNLRYQLDKFLKPPTPLLLVDNRWEFQDANWFPDFAASAEKMAWFYEQGRGSTVDGVIAISASVLERILNVLGPIQNEKYGMELSSDNALGKIQQYVEEDYDHAVYQPKQILEDLAVELLGRTKEINTMSAVRLVSELSSALGQKEIQIYLRRDEAEMKKLREFGWTGEIAKNSPAQDYLMVVNTNIGGLKTDAKTDQMIEHQAVVQEDGSVFDTVMISRTNNGVADEKFYGGNNINFLRVYVPQGAELMEAGGFNYPPEELFKVSEDWYKIDSDLANLEKEVGVHAETGTRITNEFGKTAFGNWVITPPGEKSIVYFTYRLPFKVTKTETTFKNQNLDVWKRAKELILSNAKDTDYSTYSILVQKQSGLDSQFVTRIIYPDNWQPLWREGSGLNLAMNGGEYSGTLETDKAFGLIMESK